MGSDVFRGIAWCIENRMQVINMSFRLRTHLEAVHRAMRIAFNRGIAMVAAAGNRGPDPDSVTFPARYPEALAVSAVDRNDFIWFRSSRGPAVRLTAPGVRVPTTNPDGYAESTGTSIAAAQVTGTVALLLQRKPHLTVPGLYGILTDTAEQLPELTRDEQGAGLVRADRAVAAAVRWGWNR